MKKRTHWFVAAGLALCLTLGTAPAASAAAHTMISTTT